MKFKDYCEFMNNQQNQNANNPLDTEMQNTQNKLNGITTGAKTLQDYMKKLTDLKNAQLKMAPQQSGTQSTSPVPNAIKSINSVSPTVQPNQQPVVNQPVQQPNPYK